MAWPLEICTAISSAEEQMKGQSWRDKAEVSTAALQSLAWAKIWRHKADDIEGKKLNQTTTSSRRTNMLQMTRKYGTKQTIPISRKTVTS